MIARHARQARLLYFIKARKTDPDKRTLLLAVFGWISTGWTTFPAHFLNCLEQLVIPFDSSYGLKSPVKNNLF